VFTEPSLLTPLFLFSGVREETRQGDRINLLLFFQNKESTLTTFVGFDVLTALNMKSVVG
jgi:hypothetical protein